MRILWPLLIISTIAGTATARDYVGPMTEWGVPDF